MRTKEIRQDSGQYDHIFISLECKAEEFGPHCGGFDKAKLRAQDCSLQMCHPA